MDIALRLRQAIENLHDRIERLPLAAAMASGRIAAPDYLRLLSQLYHLHGGLEEVLAGRAGLSWIYDPAAMTRQPIILADLTALGLKTPYPALPVTRHLINLFWDWSASRELALVGALYVLEGSRMGSMMLARPLAAGLGVQPRPGQGLDYHIQGLAERPASWQRFKEVLRAATLPPDGAEDMVHGAHSTMQALHDLYEAVGMTTDAPSPVPTVQLAAVR
jgi:heme oxygenase